MIGIYLPVVCWDLIETLVTHPICHQPLSALWVSQRLPNLLQGDRYNELVKESFMSAEPVVEPGRPAYSLHKFSDRTTNPMPVLRCVKWFRQARREQGQPSGVEGINRILDLVWRGICMGVSAVVAHLP
jgi:hypothetical protein